MIDEMDSRVFESTDESSSDEEQSFHENVTLRRDRTNGGAAKAQIIDQEVEKTDTNNRNLIESRMVPSSYRVHTLKPKKLSTSSSNMMMSPTLLEAASRSSFRRNQSKRNAVSRLGQASSRSSGLPEEAIRAAAHRSSSRTLRQLNSNVSLSSPKGRVVTLGSPTSSSSSDTELSSQMSSEFSPALVADFLRDNDDVYSTVMETKPVQKRPPPPLSNRRRALTRERVMMKRKQRMSQIESPATSPLCPPSRPPDVVVERKSEKDSTGDDVLLKEEKDTPTKKNTIFASILSGAFFRGRSTSSTSSESTEEKSMSCCTCNARFDSAHSRACVDCGKWYCRKCKKLKMVKLAKKTWSCKTHKIREEGGTKAVSVPDQRILARIHERVQKLLRDGQGYVQIKRMLIKDFVDEEFFERHKKKIQAACFEFDLNRTIDEMVNDDRCSREDIQNRISSHFGKDVAKTSTMYIDYLVLEKDIRNDVNTLVDSGDLTKDALRKRMIEKFANETRYNAALVDEVEDIVDNTIRDRFQVSSLPVGLKKRPRQRTESSDQELSVRELQLRLSLKHAHKTRTRCSQTHTTGTCRDMECKCKSTRFTFKNT